MSRGECNHEPIMIVDDVEFNSQTLKFIIESKFNIKCKVRNNGQKAVDEYKKRLKSKCCPPYRLILMDLMMPVMDGYDAAKIISEEVFEGSLQTDIIAFSAMSDKSNLVEKLRMSGMSGFLSKPP